MENSESSIINRLWIQEKGNQGSLCCLGVIASDTPLHLQCRKSWRPSSRHLGQYVPEIPSVRVWVIGVQSPGHSLRWQQIDCTIYTWEQWPLCATPMSLSRSRHKMLLLRILAKPVRLRRVRRSIRDAMISRRHLVSKWESWPCCAPKGICSQLDFFNRFYIEEQL